jgi:hypothetical protein
MHSLGHTLEYFAVEPFDGRGSRERVFVRHRAIALGRTSLSDDTILKECWLIGRAKERGMTGIP